MDIVMTRPVSTAVLLGRLRLARTVERLAERAAPLVPLAVRKQVIVQAAVRYRLPDQTAGDRYCGPDGITFKDLMDHA